VNLSEAKIKALSLMSEFSIDGDLIPVEENADYLNRMNRFASDAQMEISDKLPIEVSYIFMQTADTTNGYNKYDLPIDFKQHYFVNLNDEHFFDYRIENRKILIPKSYDGTFELFYSKYPNELTDATVDTYEFEIYKHAHSLIPYYMGGMAVADEKYALSDKLLNMYYQKLSQLSVPVNNAPATIQNVDGW
jgi:hypothetical protein